jgi:hypothetical protein
MVVTQRAAGASSQPKPSGTGGEGSVEIGENDGIIHRHAQSAIGLDLNPHVHELSLPEHGTDAQLNEFVSPLADIGDKVTKLSTEIGMKAMANPDEAGGAAVGVTCAIFSGRKPNRFLTERRETENLLARMGALIDAACGFVVLHGKSGTLAELTLVWALHRAGSLGPRPVILLGDAWRPFLHHLVRGGMIEDEQLAITRVAGDPEEAVAELDRFLVAEGAGGK